MVFPARNLPTLAENWGQHVERRVTGLKDRVSVIGNNAGNSGRFLGGQMAVQGAQIEEQLARTTLVERPANLSVTGNAQVEPFPRAYRQVTFNPPGGARIAQIEVYANHSYSNPGDPAALFAALMYQGQIVERLPRRIISEELRPLVLESLGTPAQFRGLTYVTLPDTGPATFDILLVRRGFTSTPSTETLTDIEVFLTPFERTI